MTEEIKIKSLSDGYTAETVSAMREKIKEMLSVATDNERKQLAVDQLGAFVEILPELFSTPTTQAYVLIIGTPLRQTINKVVAMNHLRNPLLSDSHVEKLKPVAKFANKADEPTTQVEKVMVQLDNTEAVISALNAQALNVIEDLETDSKLQDFFHTYSESAIRLSMSQLGMEVTTTEPETLNVKLLKEARSRAKLAKEQRDAVALANASQNDNNSKTKADAEESKGTGTGETEEPVINKTEGNN